MQLILIRHPPTVLGEEICCGATDAVVTESDLALARANLQAQLPVAPMMSSPLIRCRALAEQLHPAPIFDRRLQEINFGAWEGRAWSSIARAEIEAWAADPMHYAGHGGESVAQLRQRVAAWLCETVAEYETLIVITHAGVMRALAAECAAALDKKKTADERWMQLKFRQGVIYSMSISR